MRVVGLCRLSGLVSFPKSPPRRSLAACSLPDQPHLPASMPKIRKKVSIASQSLRIHRINKLNVVRSLHSHSLTDLEPCRHTPGAFTSSLIDEFSEIYAGFVALDMGD